MADRLAQIFREQDWKTDPSKSAERAAYYRSVLEQNPDILLVILDLAMPRMDGREWLRWFRGFRKDSPVIIVSAYKLDPSDEDLKPAVILEKPVAPAELLDMVGLFCGLGTPIAAEAT